MVTTTPMVWKPDTILNSGLENGYQSDPYVISLLNGDMIFSWVDNTNNIDGSSGLDVVGLRTSLSGETLGNPFQLNALVTDGGQTRQVAAALNDGGYLVVYQRDIAATGDISKIYFDRYAADGSLVASGTVAQGQLAYEDAELAVLSDGNVAIVFEGLNWSEVDYSVRGRIFNVTDNSLTPTVRYEGGGLNETNAWQSDVAALDGGGFVSVYKRSNLTSESLKFQIRDNSGALIKQADVIGSPGEDFNYNPKVCSLENGGFAVGWHSTDSNYRALNAFVKIYDASGNQIGSKVSVATSSAREGMQDILGLSDGGFYTVHYNLTSKELVGQRFDASGQKVGSANTFFADAPSAYPYNEIGATLSLTADGRINLVWSSGTDIHHAILDPRDNTINGTAAGEVLLGQVAACTIFGGDGNDTILGQGGAETLDGGEDFDRLEGGAGNDLYILKDVTRTDPNLIRAFYDSVIEKAGGGIDTVEIERVATLVNSYFLPQFVENANVVGTGSFNVTGNDLNNNLVGNDSLNVLTGLGGNDYLFGGGGSDTLVGGQGNDTYLLTNAHPITNDLIPKFGYDTVIEEADAGTDTVVVQRYFNFLTGYTLGDNIERGVISGTGSFNLTGNELNNELRGNIAANRIVAAAGDDSILGRDGNDTLAGGNGNDTVNGGSGNDVIFGGPGQDQLEGGTGNDIFNFANTPGSANADTVLDFSVADDVIRLHSSVFTALSPGVLAPGAFRVGTVAEDANDRIIYNSVDGRLFYDSDGTGANPRQLIATFSPGLFLSNLDFEIV
jgi:Ca2+-binding RTX toxin-like protein